MTNNYIAISSLAMDLKRVALAYHGGSDKTAQIFIQEAKKRIDEIDRKLVKPYLNNVIDALNTSFSKTDKKHLAEDVLMYGQIFQNYAITFEK